MLTKGLLGVFYPKKDSDFFDFLLKDYPIKKFETASDIINDRSGISKTIFVHISYPWSDVAEQLLKQHHNEEVNFCIIATELHEHDYNFYTRYDKPNITYFVNGCFNFNLKHSKVYWYMDWFRETRDNYLHSVFSSKFEYKPYYFDALLGRNKPHRLVTYDAIKNNPKIYTKFNTAVNDINFDDWDPGVDNIFIPAGTKHTVEYATYNNSQIRISQVIPERIYNNCYYSLVSETHAGNNMVFLTEKVAKPLIAKRLFILIGNRYSLKFLRELGFKTFSSVIDESYDSIEATSDRFAAALKQVNLLCESDPKAVHQIIKPILEYNSWLISNTDWLLHFRKHVRSKFKAG